MGRGESVCVCEGGWGGGRVCVFVRGKAERVITRIQRRKERRYEKDKRKERNRFENGERKRGRINSNEP